MEESEQSEPSETEPEDDSEEADDEQTERDNDSHLYLYTLFSQVCQKFCRLTVHTRRAVLGGGRGGSGGGGGEGGGPSR